MLVSVIIPTWNREDFIEECIESVLLQNYSDIEIIVSDDGSTDGTVKYASKYNGVKVLHYPIHKNAAKAMNVAIKESKGEWIKLLGSDDLLLPNAIKTFVESVDEKECIYYSDYYTLRMATGKEVLYKAPEYAYKKQFKKLLQNFYGGCSFLHRSLFDKYGYFDETIRFAEDYEYWLRLTSQKVPMKHLPFTAEYVRLHPERMSEQIPFSPINDELRNKYKKFAGF